MKRREFFRQTGNLTALGLWSALVPGAAIASAGVLDGVSLPEPEDAARDEAFWRRVRSFYVPPTDFSDLDHANTSPMSTPVFDAFSRRSSRLSQAPAERFGQLWEDTGKEIRPGLAELLGTRVEHFALTGNSTYGLNTVLHGFPLVAGDEVLVTNHEYPDMVETVRQRVRRDGIVLKTVDVPSPSEDGRDLVDRVRNAINSRTKLLLISHVSAWSGEILPVAEVTAAARERGIAVMVDAAQSVGMLDVDFERIGCDFLATSLHKWLGAPLSTGVLIMRPEHVGKVWPLHPPSWDPWSPMDIYEWAGPFNMAANASIGEALAFQKMIGLERKRARMRYLGHHWQYGLKDVPGVSILTPTQADRSFGVASFAVQGIAAETLARYLRTEKGILVQAKSGRHSPFSNAIRVSPGPYTTPTELDGFVAAVKGVVKTGLPAGYGADGPK